MAQGKACGSAGMQEKSLKKKKIIIGCLGAIVLAVLAVAGFIAWVVLCPGIRGAEEAAKAANEAAVKSGSPFRWVAKDLGRGNAMLSPTLIGEPVEASVNSLLRQDILNGLTAHEAGLTDGGTSTLSEIRLVPPASVFDTEVTEIWVMSREGGKVAYVVDMKPSATGGTDIAFTGPWK